MSDVPMLRRLAEIAPRLISPDDTVKLAALAGPAEGSRTSVFFEVWEPGGAQPVNSHPDSVEIFVFLAGEGIAYSDEHTVPVRAGDVLVLPAGSAHRIENTSTSERMYAVTVMVDDGGAMPGGFAALVAAGTPVPWDGSDPEVLPLPAEKQKRN